MDKSLLSVGLDVGSTTTQLIVSRLHIANRASSFAVPQMEITRREILYKSPVSFTPLQGQDLVDGARLRALVDGEYQAAGLDRKQVDTGAIIITGETGRKENAETVLHSLADHAGDFVVATAGPHLESVLAAKGARADRFSAESGKTVLHMDIGGGTANLALIRGGQIVATGCLNVGGRLVRLDERGAVCYRSPVLNEIFPFECGQIPPAAALQTLCNTLVQALEMAVGLRATTSLLSTLWTSEAGTAWEPPTDVECFSFSGGVAECMAQAFAPFAFGDIGVLLGKALRESRLCRGEFRLAEESIRATVIGAGCHTAQLSGSTVFYQNIPFPLKNLPVITVTAEEQEQESLADLLRQRARMHPGPVLIALPGFPATSYGQIAALAERLSRIDAQEPLLLAMEADMAKALGQALALRLGSHRPILCMDQLQVNAQCYADIGAPVDHALPVVIKTLILEN